MRGCETGFCVLRSCFRSQSEVDSSSGSSWAASRVPSRWHLSTVPWCLRALVFMSGVNDDGVPTAPADRLDSPTHYTAIRRADILLRYGGPRSHISRESAHRGAGLRVLLDGACQDRTGDLQLAKRAARVDSRRQVWR